MKIEFAKGFWRNFFISLTIVLAFSFIIYQKGNKIGGVINWSNYPNFFLLTIFGFSLLVFCMALFLACLGVREK